MSAVRKRPVEDAPSLPPVEGYDLWRARRDLDRYIHEHLTQDGLIAPELMRVRDFLRQLSGKD